MSRGMQENARRIIRARNEELPMGKRMTNLEGPFRVWVALKKLMKREGRQPDDMNATGGFDDDGQTKLEIFYCRNFKKAHRSSLNKKIYHLR